MSALLLDIQGLFLNPRPKKEIVVGSDFGVQEKWKAQ